MGIASGNKNRHGHLENSHPAHEAANRRWSTGEGFHVDDAIFINYAMLKQGFATMRQLREKGIVTNERQWTEPIYQKEGIGSFLIAVSADALQAHGVKKREFISVSKPARFAWKHFDIEAEKSVELSKVTTHPFFQTVIQEFTGLPFSRK